MCDDQIIMREKRERESGGCLTACAYSVTILEPEPVCRGRGEDTGVGWMDTMRGIFFMFYKSPTLQVAAPELFDIFSTNCDKRETSPRWSPAKTDGELLFRLAIRLFKPLMCVVFFIFIFKITLHS